jgi:hypothetical protein
MKYNSLKKVQSNSGIPFFRGCSVCRTPASGELPEGWEISIEFSSGTCTGPEEWWVCPACLPLLPESPGGVERWTGIRRRIEDRLRKNTPELVAVAQRLGMIR